VRAGLSAQDHDIARYLRSANKKVLLAVNKAEGMTDSPLLAEFHELGIGRAAPGVGGPRPGHPQPAGSRLAGLLRNPRTTRTPSLPKAPTSPSGWRWPAGPNVGKSTLINTWLGEERLVAFDQPGTTRDAIHVPFERDGQRFELIDTAGLRRKGKVFEAIEKFSVVKTLQAIADANVVLLLLDATQGVSDQDAHIAGYILESGRAVVVAINKWDATDELPAPDAGALGRAAAGVPEVRAGAAHLGHPPPGPGAGVEGDRRGARVGDLQDAHAGAHAAAAGSGEHQAPQRAGRFRPKLRYAHQGGMNPPRVVIHGNSLEHVTDAYKRYLEGRVREHFKLVGTPLRIEMRSSRNPFDESKGP
jgi:GTP-binding protein